MKVAFYECDITPPLGGYIWGSYRKVTGDDVVDKLYAKALVCESEGTYTAIVSVDTCTLPYNIHEIVTKRIREYTDITEESVCICSNHTHTGAPVFSSPELRLYADEAYLDVFYRRVADAVILAYRRLKETKISFGTSEVKGIAFSRNGEFEDGNFYTHIRDERLVRIIDKVDSNLNILKFESDGKVIGAVINYALHQATAGGVEGYSGDYSSVISRELKKVYGESFVSLFVLGACGNVNHVNPDLHVDFSGYHMHEQIGKRLAQEVEKISPKTQDVGKGIAFIKEKVTIAKRVAKDYETVVEQIQRMIDTKQSLARIRNFMHYAASNETDMEELYVQTIRIGNVLIYALPGEIYASFGLHIREKSPCEWNMVIELCNQYCGYIPSEEVFASNSYTYETSLCYHSCLVPEAGNQIVDKALEQAYQIVK